MTKPEVKRRTIDGEEVVLVKMNKLDWNLLMGATDVIVDDLKVVLAQGRVSPTGFLVFATLTAIKKADRDSQ